MATGPKLVGIAGPLTGATLPLGEGEVTIGRTPGNNLVVPDDRLLSRRHCVLRREGEKYTILDADSYNGTFVNGIPVKQQELAHGDQIKVGSSVFVFLLREAEAASGEVQLQVQIDEGGSQSEALLTLRPEDTLYWRPERSAATLPVSERTVRDLNALVRISAAINSVQGLEPLQRKLLESIFEVVPADRGAIILTGDRLDDYQSIFGWDREPDRNRPVRVSRTALGRALGERVAVLSKDIQEDQALGGAESLRGSTVRSLLAVPLTIRERTLGAIYLDTNDPQIQFDEHHLEMAAAIAGPAALALDRARRMERLESETRRLQDEIDIEHNMVGESPRMREVFQFIAKVAASDSTVLISGESGTGKELVARALHRNSPRAAQPFVAINCAALTETLLESELFGHERGAFTGAIALKKGKLEAADGGTLFLDEVRELAPALQAKLLRVLQEREFERVGGTRPIKVNIRLVAATNRNLAEAAKQGAFRPDLYFRLNVVSITLPTLRDRRGDIPLLASYFLDKYSQKLKRTGLSISSETRACLANYDWPGNVRELENAIERAVVLASSDVLLPEDLPEALLEAQASPGAQLARYHEAVRELKEQLILRAVEEAGGNYTEAAKLLGLRPTYLHRLMRSMDLKSRIKSNT